MNKRYSFVLRFVFIISLLAFKTLSSCKPRISSTKDAGVWDGEYTWYFYRDTDYQNEMNSEHPFFTVRQYKGKVEKYEDFDRFCEGDNLVSSSALSKLTNLTYLDLFSNQISDVSALSNLTNLTELIIYKNQIIDVSALSKLTNLTRLSLGVNQISDVSALSNLTNLTRLSLTANQIIDVSALSKLTNLKELGLSDNPIIKNSTHCPTNTENKKLNEFCTAYLRN